MKSYVITVMNIPESVEAAQRCIDSMPEYNIEMYAGFTPDDNPDEIARKKRINTSRFDDPRYSRRERCLSAFLSHRSLWERCLKTGEEIQIFEHDAVGVGTVPEFLNYQGCISLGAPSYGKFNHPPQLGVNPLTSKRYFPGAHAYRMKPNAAKHILEHSQDFAAPTDIYLNLDYFPWLEEYYPWPVTAVDKFSTIQNEGGCLAKHGYNKASYNLL